MSYDIRLRKQGKLAKVDHFVEGGTYPMFGTDKAELNVTYNYRILFNFRELNNKKAGDTIENLKAHVAEYGTETTDDYWEPTKGNVGYTLNILLIWAEKYPDYTWEVI